MPALIISNSSTVASPISGIRAIFNPAPSTKADTADENLYKKGCKEKTMLSVLWANLSSQ